jgi:bidirectional [NiFe] hydrogenase diaphorase subunit
MDRSVLESDPHRVLEGMAIAGYAVGASQGYIYVRGEYPLAISRLQTAIKQAKQLGCWAAASSSRRSTSASTSASAPGAFVCGEETALMASIEGKRGTPRPRPPYPAESGLWGMPTLINNVETFANVPHHPQRRRLVRRHRHRKEQGHQGLRPGRQDQEHRPDRGADGHPAARDRRGHRRRHPGRRHDQGRADRRPLRRLHPRRALLDTPVDYESLGKLGSIMGSGGMIVMDETTDMVDVARSSWSSAWTSRAASASPAAPAPCRCTAC